MSDFEHDSVQLAADESVGPPFCSACGGDRRPRAPGDADGMGCLENIHHSEDGVTL